MKRLLLVFALAGVSLFAMVTGFLPDMATTVSAADSNVLTDFEGGTPTNWFEYTGGGSSLTSEAVTFGDGDTEAKPGQVGDNTVFSATADVTSGWAGFGQENLTIDATQYDGISFWFYGADSGNSVEFELQSNGWYTTAENIFFEDDFTGWRQIVLPFSAFNADGGTYDPTQMSAWAMPLPAAVGSYMIDDVQLIELTDVGPLDGTGGWFQYGGGITLEFTTISAASGLALPGQTADTQVLSVTTSTAAGGLGENVSHDTTLYEGVSFWFYGTNSSETHEIEFQSGGDYTNSQNATFVDDFNGWRQIVLPFSTFSAKMGSYDATDMTAWVLVLTGNNSSFMIDGLTFYRCAPDTVTPEVDKTALLTDFEGGTPTNWFEYTGGGSSLTSEAVTFGDGDTEAKPGQVGDNTVFSATADVTSGWAGFGQEDLTIDATQYDGISFWFYGADSGNSVEFELQSNGWYTTAENIFFEDDFTGWRQIVLPFSAFNADGGTYDPTQMSAWAMPLPAAVGSYMIDDVQLIELTDVGPLDGTGGWFQYGGGITLEFTTISAASGLALPGQTADTQVLSVTTSTAAGGLGENVSHDTTLYEGVSFWFYGTNSSETHEIEFQSGGDYTNSQNATFVDDFNGWRQIVLPFSTFSAKMGSYDATDMTAWVLVLTGNNSSFMIDGLTFYRCAPNEVPEETLEIALSASSYDVIEGESLSVTVSLNMSHTEAVTVSVATADNTATAGVDYTAVNQTVTIAAGDTSETIVITTQEDSTAEGSESISIALSAPVNADLGSPDSAQITILDNDFTNMLADFETGHPAGDLFDGGNYVTYARELVTISDSDGYSRPGQVGDNTAMSITIDIVDDGWAISGPALPSDQDWTGYDAVSFWMYGNNSGSTFVFEIQDDGQTNKDRYDFVDDFTGWRQMILPFDAFYTVAGDVNLAEVSHWLFVMLQGADAQFLIDDVHLVSFESLADYESGYPAGDFTYGSGMSRVLNTAGSSDTYAKPEQIDSNTYMSVTGNLGSDVGMGAGLTAADWTEYEGMSFWFYGTNSGEVHQVEYQTNMYSNRARGSFTDDFTGWRYIAVPFETFSVDLGSPNLMTVTAWVLSLDGMNGDFIIDDIALYGCESNAERQVSLAQDNYSVSEGDSVTIDIELNFVYTDSVTVTVATADNTATAGVDYTAINETVTIESGQTSASVVLSTTEDFESEDNETLTLVISSPINAVLGLITETQIIIQDDEGGGSDKKVIIDDFETGIPQGTDGSATIGFVSWHNSGGSASITTTTTADAGIASVEGKNGTNQVIELTSNVTDYGGFTHAFENETADTWVPQDWRAYKGVAFWYYGVGDGAEIYLDILENRSDASTSDDAERWRYTWSDDTAGWQYVEIDFADMTRFMYSPAGAPDDGWAGKEVHGWAFGTGNTGGEDMRYIDDFAVVPRVMAIDDFEDMLLPNGTDGDGQSIGFASWADPGGSSVAITTTSTTDAGIASIDGKGGDNIVLELASNIVSWGGFTHAFENDDVNTWISQNWSTYQGICFWYYGEGDGTRVFFDVLENRNINDISDGAERWRHEWVDNTPGWQFIQVDFEDLVRNADVQQTANDGWTGAEVHGWAFGSLGTDGADLRYLDDISIYGFAVPDLRVGFDASKFTVAEGETAEITVTLNFTSEEDVTVDYGMGESQAIVDRDFTAVSGTLTIPAGELSATFEIPTLDDNKDERDEKVVLVLRNAVNADISFQQRTLLLIEDNEAEDPKLVHDFEHYHSFLDMTGDVQVTSMEIMTGDAMTRPDQDIYEYIAEITFDTTASRTGSGTEILQTFTVSDDWSSEDGVSFWFYGEGSGESYTFNLLDNQITTTADITSSEWIQVWSDEFNDAVGTLPNSNVWQYELGDGYINEIQGWGNSEFQYYTDDPANAAQDGSGNLQLTLTEINTTTTDLVCWYGPCEYASARLISEQLMEYEYGRIEARILVPDGGDGLWPAFWMLGNDINEGAPWPQSGEIDIMEYVSRKPNEIFGTIHGPDHFGGNAHGNEHIFGFPVANDYHTFAVNWHPDYIEWEVDGVLYHTATPMDSEVGGAENWVYNHPFFLLLNMAIGGNFGGSIDAANTYPQEMLVDYIRVYQAENTSERFEATFTDDTAGWQYVSLPFSEFSRSADQPTGAPDDGLTLTGVWGYGLEMPDATSGTVYLDRVYLGSEATTATTYTMFLPVVMTRSYPDLVVSSVTATESDVKVVIANNGAGSASGDFWVDAYINPVTAPTAVNQTWETQGGQGLVWGLTDVTLASGESMILTLSSSSYSANLSNFSGSIPVGATVYAQVDSANTATTYGRILEDHEMSGGTYNNIASTTSIAD